ncbi:hypothetical protein [Dysosmobacter acutus]|nr:hypothetical protein [Dysosmobacter acutus]
MTLLELSAVYRDSEVTIRARIRELRARLEQEEDPEECWRLKRRITDLTPLLQEARELASLTAHYYDRSYYRNEKYTL